MATHIKFTTLGTPVDLTDTSVNPRAAAVVTPREGGFTLRNRIDFGQVSAANKLMWTCSDTTPITETTVPFYVLNVPSRVYVKDILVTAISGETVPGFDLYYVAAVTNSDLDQMTLGWGSHKRRTAVSSASYSAAADLLAATTVNGEGVMPDGEVAGDVFGNQMLKVSTNELVFVDSFRAIDGSLASPLEPMSCAKVIRNTGALITSALDQAQHGEYYPYGGYVHIKLGPWNTNLSSDIAAAADYHDGASDAATISLEGVWEIQANCMYVPV